MFLSVSLSVVCIVGSMADAALTETLNSHWPNLLPQEQLLLTVFLSAICNVGDMRSEESKDIPNRIFTCCKHSKLSPTYIQPYSIQDTSIAWWRCVYPLS